MQDDQEFDMYSRLGEPTQAEYDLLFDKSKTEASRMAALLVLAKKTWFGYIRLAKQVLAPSLD